MSRLTRPFEWWVSEYLAGGSDAPDRSWKHGLLLCPEVLCLDFKLPYVVFLYIAHACDQVTDQQERLSRHL